jgi:hypothetical protein
MCAYSFCQYLFRTLSMVPRETPKIVVRSVYDFPWSNRSKIRARFMARALFVPWATNCSKLSRSAVVHRTS